MRFKEILEHAHWLASIFGRFMALLLFSILFFAIHFTWAGNRVLDLFRKSKRKNKAQWTVFILLIPVIGVVTYNLTMRRHKLSRRTILF